MVKKRRVLGIGFKAPLAVFFEEVEPPAEPA